MSAVRIARCDVCGAARAPDQLEPAAMRHGVGSVCADGYACAERANGVKPTRPALRLVVVNDAAPG